MRGYRFVSLGLALLWVPLACSGGTQRGPGNNVPDDPFADPAFVCNEWAEAACVEAVTGACVAESTEACVEAQSAFCLTLIPTEYDSATAEDCVAAVQEAYADARLTPAEISVVVDGQGACEFVEQTTASEGERCDEDSDCDGDLRCKIPSGQLTGTCIVAEIVGGGFSCTGENQICDSAFYCDGTNCIARPGADQACSPEVPCTEGLACEGLPGERSCVALGGVGTVCQFDAECESNICAPAGASNRCASEVILAPSAPLCENLR